jgi:hypothetical protein
MKIVVTSNNCGYARAALFRQRAVRPPWTGSPSASDRHDRAAFGLMFRLQVILCGFNRAPETSEVIIHDAQGVRSPTVLVLAPAPSAIPHPPWVIESVRSVMVRRCDRQVRSVRARHICPLRRQSPSHRSKCERRAVQCRVVRCHRGKIQFIESLTGHRKADQPSSPGRPTLPIWLAFAW